MAQSDAMIEPFEAEQVRYVNDQRGPYDFF